MCTVTRFEIQTLKIFILYEFLQISLNLKICNSAHLYRCTIGVHSFNFFENSYDFTKGFHDQGVK